MHICIENWKHISIVMFETCARCALCAVCRPANKCEWNGIEWYTRAHHTASHKKQKEFMTVDLKLCIFIQYFACVFFSSRRCFEHIKSHAGKHYIYKHICYLCISFACSLSLSLLWKTETLFKINQMMYGLCLHK